MTDRITRIVSARGRQAAVLCAMALTAGAHAAITCPNEFEEASNKLNPIFAYFGGVTSWGTNHSTQLVHSGNSCEVWANLVNDSFTAAGFAVGTFGISAPNLNVPAGADTFSVTITPPANGAMSVSVVVREDDNGNGVINIGEDDEWESAVYMLQPGTTVYNIPLASFTDTNPGDGNDVQNFSTTGRLGYWLVFETRDSYPGGQIVGPVSLHVDHLGLFVGPQELPSAGVPGDVTGDGLVGIADLLQVIGAWGACSVPPQSCSADIAPTPVDGVVGIADLLMVIANWE